MVEEVTDGENPTSELWYMPKPAGLIAIEARSAPSEVNAPPNAALRAVPNSCTATTSASLPDSESEP